MIKVLTGLMIGGALLSAQMVAGVAVVVKDQAITIHDIKHEMQVSNVSKELAINTLIRKKLEESEIKDKKITVSSTEVYDDIKETAKRNNMTVGGLYDAALSSNGITSSELKQKVKEKLLAQKLYNAIAFSKATRPTETQLREYYELHKNEFSHPESFKTIVYQSESQMSLAGKMQNPMLNTPDVLTMEKEFIYNQISPNLAALLEKTPVNSFSQIVPDGQGKFISFYIQAIEGLKSVDFETLKPQIENMVMGKAREQVLSDYFARLKENTEIHILRDIQ